jgi:hypothetical protein
MGSPTAEDGRFDNEKQHAVEITMPFYLGKYTVTRGQFRRFVEDRDYKTEAEKAGDNRTWRAVGYFNQTDEHPVVDVTWNDARNFCDWLGDQTGKKYRLPTEAEWEHSCRAGTTTAFYNGDDEDKLSEVARVHKELEGGTAPVGRYKPNAFGLYDMHGNVWQWCQDWYGEDYYKDSPRQNPQGPDAGLLHVYRGGAYGDEPRLCRAAYRRLGSAPSRCNMSIGFRVVCVASNPRGQKGVAAGPAPLAGAKQAGGADDGFKPLFNGKDLSTAPKDARRREAQQRVQQAILKLTNADVTAALADYREAAKILQDSGPDAKGELDKLNGRIDQLDKEWQAGEQPSNRAARRFFYTEWQLLDTSQDIGEQLAEAQKNLEICNKNRDRFALAKASQAAVPQTEVLQRELKQGRGENGEDATKRRKTIEEVAKKLAQFYKHVYMDMAELNPKEEDDSKAGPMRPPPKEEDDGGVARARAPGAQARSPQKEQPIPGEKKSPDLAARQARVLRWTLKFNTANGNDYRTQLASIGALLAIADGKGGYLVIRNLNRRPAKPVSADLKKIRRVFWIDSNAQSVKGLAAALGLNETPREFIAYFPESLETYLLKKELRYAGRKEADIAETTFEVVKRGTRYDVDVTGQRAK